MYHLIVKLISAVVSVDLFWKILKPILENSVLIISKRNQIESRRKIAESPIYSVLKDCKVLNGKFKGMLYPSLEAFKSSLYAKIIGSYESELDDTFENIKNKNYELIMDIGCAEGYYAVGLGLIFPESKIIAYDIIEKARDLCRKMADLNNLGDRIELRDKCTAGDLQNFEFDGKTLIICDCEGFEKQLFTSENIHNLEKTDLLIEVHDFIEINISNYLESLFSKTHKINKIKSIDDLDKAKLYDYEQTNNLDLETKRILFQEGRPQLMEWFYCESKFNN